ncbi:MAG TPA: DHH family phosphoesterase [Tepidisphaeraceae bacterium]|nr:DHH family phosphoesterase [Tepidisphaeraceae bacterium]
MTDVYRKMIDTLSRCRRVLVTTHVRPDGDALGSTAAMVLGLKKKGIHAEVLLLSHLPRKYAFIYEEHDIPFIDVENGWPDDPSNATGSLRVHPSASDECETGTGTVSHYPLPVQELEKALEKTGTGTVFSSEAGLSSSSAEPGAVDSFLDGYDALIVIDTGTWSQLPGLEPRVAKFTKPKLVIDHHLTQQDWADQKLVVTEAAAAGEIVFELLEQWDVELDQPIATALFLAICTDTGWFQFSNTRPFTMHLAAELMEAGVDTDRMYQLLYQNERAERIALQARALQSLELLAGGKLAVITVTRDDFVQTKAAVPDTENLINLPLQIRTVEVSLLFTEPLDNGEKVGPVRVSLRSKGQVDVAKFAEQFGGGGHARAAGLKVDGAFAEVRERVVAAMMQRLAS